MMDIDEQISELRRNLEDLKKRWPAHSVKPEMIHEMERIEDKLSELVGRQSGAKETE